MRTVVQWTCTTNTRKLNARGATASESLPSAEAIHVRVIPREVLQAVYATTVGTLQTAANGVLRLMDRVRMDAVKNLAKVASTFCCEKTALPALTAFLHITTLCEPLTILMPSFLEVLVRARQT
jgi:hypothetical protein